MSITQRFGEKFVWQRRFPFSIQKEVNQPIKIFSYQNHYIRMGCVNSANTNSSNSIGPAVKCSRCNAFLQRQNAQNHKCRNEPVMTPKNYLPLNPVLQPFFPINPNPTDISLYGHEIKQSANQTIDMKVPINSERTLFKWIKDKTYIYPLSVKGFPKNVIKQRTFQEKMLWFRLKMEEMRISWEHGCETIRVSRGNVLMSCYEQMKAINFHKEVKIKFDDESVEDAGGLLREWIHLTMKELFSLELGLFQFCDTQESSYKIKWDKDIFQELALEYMWIMGVLLGKAIFERISIECRLNRTLLRQLCEQPVHLHDVYSFDRKLHSSWKQILRFESAENLFLTFSELKIHDDGTKEEVDLIRNGRNTEVTDENKNIYVTEMINLYCTRSIQKYLQRMKLGLSYVVPPDFLTIFEPHEFQMLIGGPPHIDLENWIQNTVYTNGYSAQDQTIVDFWNIVREYDQRQLANLLHYCTGSTRVPILGFKYLQSNRNTVAKFTIQKQEYDKNNPYPKGHTCFNRLQLPVYETYDEMKQRMDTVVKQEVSHFGLD